MKRSIGILLALCLFFGGIQTSYAAQMQADAWAVAALTEAQKNGLVYPELLEKGTAPITRQEFVWLAVRFYEKATGEMAAPQGGSPFVDDTTRQTAFAYQKGIISGVSPTEFGPDRALTREQMALILERTLVAVGAENKADTAGIAFTDIQGLQVASQNAIQSLNQKKILRGKAADSFAPYAQVTVQEAVVAYLGAFHYLFAVGETGITLGKRSVSIGDTAEDLLAGFGQPKRIDQGTQGILRYIYQIDGKELLFVTLWKGHVAEIFSNSDLFLYQGISGGADRSALTGAWQIFAEKKEAKRFVAAAEVVISMDYENAIDSILLRSPALAQENPANLRAFQGNLQEELWDLVNAARMRKQETPLQKSAQAEQSAMAHSAWMQEAQTLAYTGENEGSPFQRMQSAGLTFSTAAETVAKTDADAVAVYREWMRAAGTYGNLMNAQLTHAGIGTSSKGSIVYVTMDLYAAQ